jgi:hypothetical protein
MTGFWRTYADDGIDLQARADVAVVMATILRPGLVDAVQSVFAQTFAGRIQLLLGVDRPIGDLEVLERACRNRPRNCIVQVLYPGYSTSVRHGGVSSAQSGGALRTVLSYLANTPFIAYLDDDNWWHPDHLRQLRQAIEGHDWSYSLRWFVHPQSRRAVCIDEWESVGPDRGVFREQFGGFVDPNCLMINKLRGVETMPLWNTPLPGDHSGMSSDRVVFEVLRRYGRGAATGQATVYYHIDPKDTRHAVRLSAMGGRYEAAGQIVSPGLELARNR